jgi:hypothetical protein
MTHPTKRCSRCGAYKSLDEYRQPGKSSWCVPCEREYNRLYKSSDRGKAANAKSSAEYRERKKTGEPLEKADVRSPCDTCSSLTLCRVEIRRPSFWPACFECSRYYDPALAIIVYRGKTTERAEVVA